MPSKTPKQARFMRAVAHGWKPSRVKAPPVSVAKEFVEADKKYSGGFAENRYVKGGLATMNEVDATSERQRPLRQLGNWQEGGEVDYQVEPGVYEAPNVEEIGPAMEQALRDMEERRKARDAEVIDYTWDKTKPLEMETQLDERLAAMSGPEQVEYVKPRLLAAMREMKTIGESPFGKRYSIWDYGQSQKQVNLWRDKWSKALQQQAREAEGEEKGMQRGGRVIPLQPGTSGHIRRAALAEQGYTYDPNTNSMQEPETTIAAGAAETPTYDPYYGAGNYANAWNLGSMPWRNWENYQPDGEGGYTFEPPEDWYDPGGGGPGGPGAAPPRIAPTDPASYVGASADVSGRESPYREQLREHQSKIKEILGTGSARGGPVRGYQEGGTARADNPFDPVAQKYQWRSWERKHGRDPDEPEVVAPPAPEEAPPPPEDEGGFAAWLRSFFIPDPETENVEAVEEYMESIDQARGGRVNYQTGGLAQVNRPRGGVPPWVEPVEQGYQFGGRATGMMAPRMARRAMQQYRGVPPQRAPIQPRGGLFAALQRGDPRLRVTGRTSRTLPPGIDPRAVAANPQGYAQWAADPRSAGARGILPGEMRGPMGPINIVDPTTGESTPYWGPGGREGYDERVRRMQRGPMAPGGGPFQLPRKPMPGPSGPFVPPGGGGIPPWKQLPGQRRQVPPSPGRAYPGGPGGPVPGGEQLPMGGARVPPNQQGYLQRMRMMNRPPSGPVGGGANRVGMRDQQGALSRAMQRGTGRPPMSRRYAFGRGAQQP